MQPRRSGDVRDRYAVAVRYLRERPSSIGDSIDTGVPAGVGEFHPVVATALTVSREDN